MKLLWRRIQWVAAAGQIIILIVYPQLAGGQGLKIVRQTIEFYPPLTQGKTHPVTLSFDAHVYSGNSRFQELAKDPSQLTEDEKFLISVVQANTSGSGADIVALWEPNEREEVKQLVNDNELFVGNRAFYTKIQDSTLRAKIYYGSYILFFVEHSGEAFAPLIKEYPVKATGSGYYLTNALQSDPVFQYFVTVYSKTLPLKTKP
jgi:hypothetical protein